jgi:hypothetical protein
MFHPRLVAVVTALTLMGGATALHAEYSLSQLEEIDRLITARNCAGLWSYVQANPDILSGNDPLANELRVFVSATERGQLNCFASRSNVNDTNVIGALPEAAAEQIY